MLILAIIDDLVNDEHMVITWVTAFILLNIETINIQVFCQLLHRATDYFLLLIKFRNISTLECYSCSEHSLVPPRHCAPSNEMTILTKTKWPFRQKKWFFWQNTASLTLFTRFIRFFQSRALKEIFYRANVNCIRWPHYQ